LRDIVGRLTFRDVDQEPPERWLEGLQLDAVIHLAVSYGRDNEPASRVAATNVLFPLTLLELAAHVGVRTFINAATTYRVDYKYLQSHTLSKQQFVEWGRLCTPRGMRFVNVRLFHPYGPGDDPSKFVPQMVRACLTQAGDIPLTLGEQRKDFLHVHDFVTAMQTLLDAPERLPDGFSTLDCGSGHAASIRHFVETLHRLTGSRATLRFGALPYRENENMFSQADPSQLRALGWGPSVSLEEGVKSILREDFGRR
jgi:nucleoside-diphosphate-sugar epimerase